MTGQIITIREIIKSERYIKILDENLQLSVQNLDLGRQVTFQQDNDPTHMSKSVTEWLQKNKFKVLSWLSISQNPVENLWQELKFQIKNLEELKCVTIEGGKKISEKNLLKSDQKLLKTIAASYKDERPCYWLLILWKLFNFFHFSYCMNNFLSSFVYFSSHI